MFDKEKQNDFKNVMSFRVTPLYLSVNFINHWLKNTHVVSIPVEDHSGRRFCKLGFVYFHVSKTCGTYRPRAEDVARRIRIDLADAYETS